MVSGGELGVLVDDKAVQGGAEDASPDRFYYLRHPEVVVRSSRSNHAPYLLTSVL